MFRQQIETFSIDEIRTCLRGASSTGHDVSDFEFCFFGHIVVLCQCGFESLEMLENGSRSKMGNFTREITRTSWTRYSWNHEYLKDFLLDCKVLWMTLEQLVEIFIELPIFDSSRAICVLLRWQNHVLVPSG